LADPGTAWKEARSKMKQVAPMTRSRLDVSIENPYSGFRTGTNNVYKVRAPRLAVVVYRTHRFYVYKP